MISGSTERTVLLRVAQYGEIYCINRSNLLAGDEKTGGDLGLVGYYSTNRTNRDYALTGGVSDSYIELSFMPLWTAQVFAH